MIGVSTITSKRQITIPVALFEALGFVIGDKVVIEKVDGGLRLKKAVDLVAKLAGSVSVGQSMPDIDAVISVAKKNRFKSKS